MFRRVCFSAVSFSWKVKGPAYLCIFHFPTFCDLTYGRVIIQLPVFYIFLHFDLAQLKLSYLQPNRRLSLQPNGTKPIKLLVLVAYASVFANHVQFILYYTSIYCSIPSIYHNGNALHASSLGLHHIHFMDMHTEIFQHAYVEQPRAHTHSYVRVHRHWSLQCMQIYTEKDFSRRRR